MTKHKTKSVMSSPTKGKGGGKGKGEAGGKQSHIDLKDCPLDLKEFASMDFASVPRFASVSFLSQFQSYPFEPELPRVLF